MGEKVHEPFLFLSHLSDGLAVSSFLLLGSPGKQGPQAKWRELTESLALTGLVVMR